nr:MAG TPA: hypothetical protein [Caudoviricetes sp.]
MVFRLKWTKNTPTGQKCLKSLEKAEGMQCNYNAEVLPPKTGGRRPPPALSFVRGRRFVTLYPNRKTDAYIRITKSDRTRGVLDAFRGGRRRSGPHSPLRMHLVPLERADDER